MVILDEATSALDADTEARLHAALHDFLNDRTTLIIAHRLSAVKQADRVYVFDGGEIIEHGVHADLIRERRAVRPPLRQPATLTSTGRCVLPRDNKMKATAVANAVHGRPRYRR